MEYEVIAWFREQDTERSRFASWADAVSCANGLVRDAGAFYAEVHRDGHGRFHCVEAAAFADADADADRRAGGGA